MMEKDSPTLVSIIIPVYNAEKYILETIKSVLSQDYKPIEIIVIDDGSTDNTAKIIKSLNTEIRYVFQENQGVSAARNHGFKLSEGQYLCFLDADDWYYPQNIKEKVNYFLHNPSCGLIHSWVEITDRNLNIKKTVMGKEGENITQEVLNFIPTAIPSPSNVMLKRSVINEIGGFDLNLSTSADFDMWLRITHKFKVGMLNKPLVKYRLHEDGMFTNLALQLKDMNYILKKYKNSAYSIYNWNVLQDRFYNSLLKASLKKFQIRIFLKLLLQFLQYKFLAIRV